MKKILISLILLSLISFNVYGESYTIPLNYQVLPTYTVSVPKVVDVSRDETSFVFTVSGDIYLDNTLEVVFVDNATISNGTNSTNINVEQDKNTFTCNELINTYTGTVTLNHKPLKSGNWSGELIVLIALKEGAYSQ